MNWKSWIQKIKGMSREASETEITAVATPEVAKPSALEPAADSIYTPPTVTTQSRVVVRAGFVNGQPGIIEVDEVTSKRLASRPVGSRKQGIADSLDSWRRGAK